MISRRTFIEAATVSGAALTVGGSEASEAEVRQAEPFTLDYAPHFGMFRTLGGDDLVSQLEFMADQGFRSLEDNGMMRRSVEDQKRIAGAMERLGMRMGVFVANFGTAFGRPSLSSGNADMREQFLQEIRDCVEVAKRVNARWMTVVPGNLEPRLEMDFQNANAVETLKKAAGILEPHDLVMVLEPLNHWRDHPGLFLSTTPQAYLLCKAVGSPSCKILFDIYHQQISEGNLIPNIDHAWSEIAYFQIGDNPGRREPTTGEINYTNVFAHLHGRGYTDILGMEHGNSTSGAEGEQAVIDAYRSCDPE